MGAARSARRATSRWAISLATRTLIGKEGEGIVWAELEHREHVVIHQTDVAPFPLCGIGPHGVPGL